MVVSKHWLLDFKSNINGQPSPIEFSKKDQAYDAQQSFFKHFECEVIEIKRTVITLTLWGYDVQTIYKNGEKMNIAKIYFILPRTMECGNYHGCLFLKEDKWRELDVASKVEIEWNSTPPHDYALLTENSKITIVIEEFSDDKGTTCLVTNNNTSEILFDAFSGRNDDTYPAGHLNISESIVISPQKVLFMTTDLHNKIYKQIIEGYGYTLYTVFEDEEFETDNLLRYTIVVCETQDELKKWALRYQKEAREADFKVNIVVC